MPDITLLLALHNHQPVGNFGHVFETAFERCYKPVLDAFHDAPHARLSLHHTGPLLQWLDAHRPDYIAQIKEMVERGQVEILGGGFYEPMLSILPERDAIGQIREMADWCEDKLGTRPRGMWLAERVWEPDLARIIAEGGMEYTLLDDTHFYNAGLTNPIMHGHYLTEKSGRSIKVLPIAKDLRYALPFMAVDETIAVLRRLAEETGNKNVAVTYGDDGEKFGLWPDTHDWVFGKGWLKDFLAALGEQSDWLATQTLSERLDSKPPQGLIYLPTASYDEMGHWSLPAESASRFDDFRHKLEDEGLYEGGRAFVRGGIWQGFLTKYSESNAIHKRVVRASRRLEAAESDHPEAAEALAEARDHLYQAQCNCAYWHGLFGGIYLNWLRSALYEHLYRCEAIVDGVCCENDDYRRVTAEDLDLDGRTELIVETPWLALVIRPEEGGSLGEIGLRALGFNPTDVLSRRIEGFHRLLDRAVVMDRETARAERGEEDDGKPMSIHDVVLAKEPGLEKLVVQDAVPRYSAQDALYPFGDVNALLAGLRDGTAKPLCDLRQTHYNVDMVRGENPVEIALSTMAPIGSDSAVVVRKRYALAGTGDGFDVAYAIKAVGVVQGRFSVTWNLTLLAPDAPDRTLQIDGGECLPMNAAGVSEGRAVRLTDGWRGVALELTTPDAADILHYPVETVSQSEDGFERTYQGTSVMLSWPLAMAPGQELLIQIGFEVIPSQTSGV